MDKLTLKVHQYEKRKGTQNVVRIDSIAMRELERLQRATGYPLKQLVSKMIMFASERVEIEED